MFKRCILGALAVCLVLGSYALTKPVPVNRDGDAQRISDLVKQLGSSKFAERTQAQKELEAIGAPALEALRNAAKDGELETAKRATELVRKLEDRMFTANLLTPKRVHLKVKDMPVLDAVAELSRLSGYPIQVQGDRTKVSESKVTLDTGDVTFWEALDKLCAKGGLTELNQQGGIGTTPGGPPVIDLPPQPPINIRPIRRPPIRIQPPAEKQLPPIPPDQPQGTVEGNAGQAVGVAAQAQDLPAKAQPAQPAQDQPIQVQPLPVQIQPVPFPGGGPRPRPGFGAPGQIILVPGVAKNELVSYAGAVRIRVIPVVEQVKQQLAKAGQYIVILDVAAEPKLQSFNITGAFTLEKCIDDQGQTLTVAANVPVNPRGPGGVNPGVPADGGPAPANGPANDPGVQAQPAIQIFQPAGGPMADVAMPFPGIGFGGNRQVTIRLKAGEKAAKALKELAGTLNATVMTPPEALISFDNVMKGAGKTAKGKSGGSLEVTAIEKMNNGEYKVQMKMESPQGGVGFQGGFPGGGGFGGVIMPMPAPALPPLPIQGGAAFQVQGVQIQAVQVQGVQVQVQVGGGIQVGGNQAAPGIAVPIGPGFGGNGMPELVDAKGNKFQVTQVPARRFNVNPNGVAIQEMTIIYRAPAGAGDPDRLVVTGTRMATITIPFSFQNVPLQ